MSDTFGDYIEDKKERSSSPKFRKTEFLKLEEGEHLVRILDTHEVRHYAHYVGGAYVKCLGDECPLCQNNKRIMYEHPEDFREVKGWNPRRDRYYINALNRTLGKVCPKCGTQAAPNKDICPGCGTPLTVEVKPLDKVVVLTGGRNLFEDLKVLSKSVKDEEDNRVDIRTYDWLFIVRGKGRDKAITVTPRYFPNKAGLLELPEGQELFDLEKAVISLEPDEVLDMLNGASLHDIFVVRRAKKVGEPDTEEKKLSEQVRSDIEFAIGELFSE